ncbi:YlqD family protein [Aeribacillus pallidus]|jgi:hypothetical protein|uniref:YlqD family protein n=1 Tax=Aeribacillus pallidus TaxID=33936 RepID=UPI001D702462|nr:YlqD family protein [Bacillus sp. (in: firmicutes)]
MKIIQPVTVKRVLTESAKEELLQMFQARKSRWEKEINQLKFEMKKLEKGKKIASPVLKANFSNEIQMRKEKIKMVDFQIEQLNILPIGSEIKDGEVQALIDIQIGDRWDEVVPKEIVIKDGIVEDIR